MNKVIQTSNTKNIHRAKHGKGVPYLLMTRAAAQDAKISMLARGVLAHILSLPDTFDAGETYLTSQGMSRADARTALRELKAAGYYRPRQQYRDARNRIRYTAPQWCELPTTVLPDSVRRMPVTRNPVHPLPFDTFEPATLINTQENPFRESDTENPLTESTAAHCTDAATVQQPVLVDDLDSGELDIAADGTDTRRVEASHDERPPALSPSSAPPPSPDAAALRSELEAFGVHEPQLSEVIAAFTPDTIRAALKHTRQVARTNPPGYFMMALHHNWHITPPLLPPTARDGHDYTQGKYAHIIES
jgi:hypothetical protein